MSSAAKTGPQPRPWGSLIGATGFRHGLVLPPRAVVQTFAEPAEIVNVAVPSVPGSGWRSASGGIARTPLDAETAAVGEALERYAGHCCALPRRPRAKLVGAQVLELEEFSLYSAEQRCNSDFPHRQLYEQEQTYTNVFGLGDNREAWVRAELVGLSPEGAAVATSSGLAASPTNVGALLRAVQELVERDALMITWLHGVPARRVALPARYEGEVSALAGAVACFDATPAFSPHPVALVAGQLPLRGVPRYSLGAACRAKWADAVEKAYLEWLQGVTFVGHYREYHPRLVFRSAREVRTFEDHAVYYSVRPDQWARLPLLRGGPADPPADGPESLESLVSRLLAGGIRLFYRELTTCDVRQAGVCVVRALSPDLAPIHCDERWPFLGGTVADVRRRYPWVDEHRLRFPNPLPHPLG